jgi:protein-tyrosine phosphatase
MRNILFLCTGNYYRSRFAEMLFNQMAAAAGTAWRASSRALAIELGAHNVGPLSPHALSRLRRSGIETEGLSRFPMAVRDTDFAAADIVIAIKESEHRPLLSERHPAWAEEVIYWNVHDVPPSRDYDPLDEIEKHVVRLVQSLAEHESGRMSPGSVLPVR